MEKQTVILPEYALYAGGCTDVKRQRRIVGFVEECFGANPTFSPMVGEGGTECRMRGEFFNVHNNSSPRKNTPLTHFCKFASLINKNIPLPHSCSFAVNGSPVGVCNDFVILPPSSRPQLTRAGARGNGLVPFLRERPSNGEDKASFNGFGKITPNPLTVKNLFPYSPIHLLPSKKVAFTLAEVLITLGVIGIVAAMTLPSVIGNAQKQATASKVHKFYNTINNAVQFAIAENGDVSEWMGTPKNMTYDENLEFLQKYFFPHIKYKRYDNCYENAVCVYLYQGGMFFFRYDVNGGDIFYFVNGRFDRDPRNSFGFQFNKVEGNDEDGNQITRINRKTSVEPYAYGWDGTYEKLKTHSFRGCYKGQIRLGTFCTKLLQINNWKITDDYPW